MKKNKLLNAVIGAPSFVWLIAFYAIPVCLVFLLAFKPVDSFGGIGEGWSLKTLKDLANPTYPMIIWRTVWLGVVATVLSVAIAIPISYHLSRMTSKLKNVFLLLIIVPFWTNFLVRIYAWKVFLHPEGPLAKLLIACHIIDPGTMLLYNQWAVLAVMVYTYIPFAVLPIYTSAEKFDFSLIEAAKDLGAGSFYAFRKVFLPGIMKGVWTAVTVVLIPAFGAYLIPSLVGGPTSELLGDKIAQRALYDRNLPHASALSALLMLVVFMPLLIGMWTMKIQARRREAQK